jgi:dihydroorotase
MEQLTLTRPDDWHLHLRDGAILKAVLPHTAREFGRGLIMPNLRPPIVTLEDAQAYRQRIMEAVPEGRHFEPVMSLYLTDRTQPEDIATAAQSGIIKSCKLYPNGATTNSDSGVTDWNHLDKNLAAMAKHGIILCVHGEVTDPSTDIFDREAIFIEEILKPIIERHSHLRVIMEHITTKQAADFVMGSDDRIAATVTAHHLLMNRNDIFKGGIRPHHYCLPILKRESHRQALVAAVTSGSSQFFLGTDSAPHPKGAKESACGCAGMYTAHAAMPLYAEVFDEAGALDKLEGFASFYGPDFYRLPRNEDKITLIKETWEVPSEFSLANEMIVPLRAGETIAWKLEGEEY